MNQIIYIGKEQSAVVTNQWKTFFNFFDMYQMEMMCEKKTANQNRTLHFRLSKIADGSELWADSLPLSASDMKEERLTGTEVKNFIHRGFISLKRYLEEQPSLDKTEWKVLSFIRQALSIHLLTGEECFIYILSGNEAVASVSFGKVQKIYFMRFQTENHNAENITTVDDLDVAKTVDYMVEHQLYRDEKMLLELIN